jgi:hypothetical protein
MLHVQHRCIVEGCGRLRRPTRQRAAAIVGSDDGLAESAALRRFHAIARGGSCTKARPLRWPVAAAQASRERPSGCDRLQRSDPRAYFRWPSAWPVPHATVPIDASRWHCRQDTASDRTLLAHSCRASLATSARAAGASLPRRPSHRCLRPGTNWIAKSGSVTWV